MRWKKGRRTLICIRAAISFRDAVLLSEGIRFRLVARSDSYNDSVRVIPYGPYERNRCDIGCAQDAKTKRRLGGPDGRGRIQSLEESGLG